MDVVCEDCGQQGKDTLGNLLVAGWTQKGESSLSKRGWMCPSCLTTLAKIPSAPPAPPPAPKGKP